MQRVLAAGGRSIERVFCAGSAGRRTMRLLVEAGSSGAHTRQHRPVAALSSALVWFDESAAIDIVVLEVGGTKPVLRGSASPQHPSAERRVELHWSGMPRVVRRAIRVAGEIDVGPDGHFVCGLIDLDTIEVIA